MVAYKSSAVASFLKSPEPACRAVLLYGPDAGLVAERASALAVTLGRRAAGETETVRLDDRDLAEDPARLEVELKTTPMFASKSVIRVTAGQRLDVQALKALLATPSENALIVEADDLGRPLAALDEDLRERDRPLRHQSRVWSVDENRAARGVRRSHEVGNG
jgi:DNA polymerase-3 subunit delta